MLRASVLGDLRTAVMAPVPGAASRFVFALPQPDGRVYVGITDEPTDGTIPDVPEASETEIGFLLDILGAVVARPLRRDDVVGTYAGLRPLLDAEGSTADLSRRHAVLESPDGVITIVGGKLTTYRRMAQDAVDAALRRTDLPAGPCRTRDLPLVGAAPREVLAGLEAPTRLIRRHGTEALAVMEHGRAQGLSDDELLEPVADGVPATPAELLWGLTHEGALDVDDLLERRTRVGLVPADRALAEPAVEALLAATPRG